MIKIIFVMYNHETDGVKVSLDDKIHVSFNCQKCNASVHLDEPSDIAYLIRLARETPPNISTENDYIYKDIPSNLDVYSRTFTIVSLYF